jgi:RimJ/RimL family protein N-acetyltransferase
MAYQGGVWTDEETGHYLESQLAHWEAHGFGLWLFTRRRDGEPVGAAGLRLTEIRGRAEVELSYALYPPMWGRGLGTEMAGAIVDVALGPLGVTELVACAIPSHHASRRVMEKLGFVHEREIHYAGRPHVMYRLRSVLAAAGITRW